MRSPAEILRVLIEFVFILLGSMILWVAVTGRYFFDRRSLLWILIGAVALLSGVRSLWRARQSAALQEDRVRGASFVLLGLMMLGVAVLPFRFEATLMGVAAGALILRGLTIAVMVMRKG
jgi:hypothetical protein